MWADNEASLDLLGFEQLIGTTVYLVQRKQLLPLTIGVFGDWGSGKSTLMAMARKRLDANNRFVCVSFSPWQHESYDDVKAALMVAVLTALRQRRSLLQKAGAEAPRLWNRLARRINVFRAVQFAAKGIGAATAFFGGHGELATGLTISGLGDLTQLMQTPELAELVEESREIVSDKVATETSGDDQTKESIEQGVAEFRRDFEHLLKKIDIDAMVIFIDDLDRCLPKAIIETLEAVRLFLAVPKTAFIIAADERIIQHAIVTRYPELPSQAVNIGRDYLEKIVQIPVRIPPLTSPETETYLNLLACQIHLDDAAFNKMVETASANRSNASLDVALNYGIVKTHFGQVPAELEAQMRLIARIAPTLCGGLAGNPRQIKRFMNTLIMRQHLAKARGVVLDEAVLAKLMILEYFHEALFRQLFQWHHEAGGQVPQIQALEAAARSTDRKIDTHPASLPQGWLDDSSVRDWLLLEPPLASVNLDPYLYVSRDRVLAPTAPSRRLSQPLQELLGKLQSVSDAERELGVKGVVTLPADDLRAVYDELLRQFQRDPHAINGQLGAVLGTVAAKRRELVSPLAQTLRAVPLASIQPALAPTLRGLFGAKEALPPEINDVLQGWANQSTVTRLAAAAKRALEPVRKT